MSVKEQQSAAMKAALWRRDEGIDVNKKMQCWKEKVEEGARKLSL